MTPTKSALVTLATCDSKHYWVRLGFGTMLGLFVLLLTMVGWSLLAASTATSLSHSVDSKMDTHDARQNGQFAVIDERLRNMGATQDKMQSMLQDLWDHQHNPPPP